MAHELCRNGSAAQQHCALTCCCAHLVVSSPELMFTRHDGCSSRLAQIKAESHQHCVPTHNFALNHPPPTVVVAPPDSWSHYKIRQTLGRGNTATALLVRFPNGFECTMKAFKPRSPEAPMERQPLYISTREVTMQQRAAATGGAPRVYHYAPSDKTTNFTVIFSELMLRDAWENSTLGISGQSTSQDGARTPCGDLPASASNALTTCDEMLTAMRALDAAGVRHADLKLDHFMRTADGALRIVDYSAARDLNASAGADVSVLTAAAQCPPTNVEDFVERNACFHDVQHDGKHGSVPHQRNNGGAGHLLTTFVEHAPARARVANAGGGSPFPQPYECFAAVCFPRLVQAALDAQRRRASSGCLVASVPLATAA